MLADTLSELDPKVAAASLATAVLSLGGPGLPVEAADISKISEELILEALADLDINDRNSKEAENKLRKYLIRFVDEYLMKNFNRLEISKNLGDRGDLPRGAYSVSLGQNVAGKQKISFVENCIRDADIEQHLMPEGDENAHKLSIFIKEIVNNTGRRSIMVICANRNGSALLVDCVFQMLPNLFDVSAATCPLDYIKIFVDKYPVRIKIGKSSEFKYFWKNENVQVEDGKITIQPDPDFFKGNKNKRWTSLVYGKMHEGWTEVVVGFAFDETTYLNDLR